MQRPIAPESLLREPHPMTTTQPDDATDHLRPTGVSYDVHSTQRGTDSVLP